MPEQVEQISTDGPLPRKRVVFTQGGKGGVGKTGFMIHLAEWFLANEIPFTLPDLDTENKSRGSLKHYFSGLDWFIDCLSGGAPGVTRRYGSRLGPGSLELVWPGPEPDLHILAQSADACLLSAEGDANWPDIPWVFHWYGKPIGHSLKGWRRSAEAAEVPGLLFHDLRRSAIRNMERAGIPRKIAMSISGHRTESVYLRYDIVSQGRPTD